MVKRKEKKKQCSAAFTIYLFLFFCGSYSEPSALLTDGPASERIKWSRELADWWLLLLRKCLNN